MVSKVALSPEIVALVKVPESVIEATCLERRVESELDCLVMVGLMSEARICSLKTVVFMVGPDW